MNEVSWLKNEKAACCKTRMTKKLPVSSSNSSLHSELKLPSPRPSSSYRLEKAAAAKPGTISILKIKYTKQRVSRLRWYDEKRLWFSQPAR